MLQLDQPMYGLAAIPEEPSSVVAAEAAAGVVDLAAGRRGRGGRCAGDHQGAGPVAQPPPGRW